MPADVNRDLGTIREALMLIVEALEATDEEMRRRKAGFLRALVTIKLKPRRASRP